MCFADVGSDLNHASQNSILQKELRWQGSVETSPSFPAASWECRYPSKQVDLVSLAEEESEEGARAVFARDCLGGLPWPCCSSLEAGAGFCVCAIWAPGTWLQLLESSRGGMSTGNNRAAFWRGFLLSSVLQWCFYVVHLLRYTSVVQFSHLSPYLIAS